ncbi:MAG: ISNCY family transposase [Bacillota bacterium]
MGPEEARRVYVLERLVAGELTSAQAAELIGLSQRQVKRLKQAFTKEGPASLLHDNRGRQPRHTTPDAIGQLVVDIVSSGCKDASCLHMSELLMEHHRVAVSAKTIARILAQAAIPNRHTHRAPRKTRCRDRMPREGLLVQVDASPCAWLEDRGPKLALHGAIDNATSKVLGLVFAPEETLNAYLTRMQQVIQDHGVPQSLYSDRHSIFFAPKRDQLTIEDELQGRVVGFTQFGEALSELGINQVAARSPQAKGRSERLRRTRQSRLLVELRWQGMATLEAANRFLPGFLHRYNQRFAV